jgi:hypothetical protein
VRPKFLTLARRVKRDTSINQNRFHCRHDLPEGVERMAVHAFAPWGFFYFTTNIS